MTIKLRISEDQIKYLNEVIRGREGVKGIFTQTSLAMSAPTNYYHITTELLYAYLDPNAYFDNLVIPALNGLEVHTFLELSPIHRVNMRILNDAAKTIQKRKQEIENLVLDTYIANLENTDNILGKLARASLQLNELRLYWQF